MMYQSSKGAVAIDTMPLTYAKNAHAKLMSAEPGRTAEIEALAAHVAKLTADAENDNPRAVIGGNNPPEDEPAPVLVGRKALEDHAGDLLSEAANWADGVEIANQGQADAVGRLHRQLQQAAGLIDDGAAKEKKPHNDAVNEIGTWQNGFTAKGLKKTPDGKLTKAILATGNLTTAWLKKQDADRLVREQATAQAAAEAAKVAVAARAEARETTDLTVIDRADDALATAEALIREAKGVATEKVQSGGGGGYRAMSLRAVWRAEISSDPGSWALAHGHFRQDPEYMADFHALIQLWADRAVRIEATRLLGVPGFNFIEDKRV